MIGMTWDKAKGAFKDWQKVQYRMRRATLRALSKFGAFVRQRSRTSIKKNSKTSMAGQPPFSHPPHLLRTGIVFVVEPATENVVIGPVKLNKPSPYILKALEHGGQTFIMGTGKKKGALIPTTIEPRPFMQPAFDAELPKASYLWANSLRS